MQFDEVILMVKGEMYLALEGEKMTIQPNDLVFLPANHLHYGWRESSDYIEFYWLHIVHGAEVLPTHTHLSNCADLLALFRIMIRVARFSAQEADCAATLLVCQARRDIIEHFNPHMTLADDVCTYIRENFSKDISVSSIAAKFGYSPDYISVRLRSCIGMSTKAYITNCRISHAKSILLQSNLTLDTIAEKCGFSDSKQFFKIFKRQVGMTPGEYRLSHPEVSYIGNGVKKPTV